MKTFKIHFVEHVGSSERNRNIFTVAAKNSVESVEKFRIYGPKKSFIEGVYVEINHSTWDKSALAKVSA